MNSLKGRTVKLTIFLLPVFLGGCAYAGHPIAAFAPENTIPTYVSPLAYKGLSCRDLAEEQIDAQVHLTYEIKEVNRLRHFDFHLEERKSAIAALKGQQTALERAQVAARCQITSAQRGTATPRF